MRRALLFLALLAVPTVARADQYLEASPREYTLEGADRLRIQYSVGRLHVEGDDGSTVRVLVRVNCRGKSYDDCREEVGRIRIDHRVSGGTLALEFQGIHKHPTGNVGVEAHILAPRRLAARIEMGVGDLQIDDMAADLDVELGVGDLTAHVDPRHYRTAEAQAGVGEATIRTAEGTVREHGFIGHTASWEYGRGGSAVNAKVGVGDARIDLR